MTSDGCKAVLLSLSPQEARSIKSILASENLFHEADFLGAIQLPNDAFKRSQYRGDNRYCDAKKKMSPVNSNSHPVRRGKIQR
jgi:hypothetical protein